MYYREIGQWNLQINRPVNGIAFHPPAWGSENRRRGGTPVFTRSYEVKLHGYR
jgi:hypothetical protein